MAVHEGDRLKLKLPFLAGQDPDYFPFIADEEPVNGLRRDGVTPDQRVWGYSRRTRQDGTTYVTRTQESVSYLFKRKLMVEGFDVVSLKTGELISLDVLEDIREADFDAFNAEQNRRNPAGPRQAFTVGPAAAPVAKTAAKPTKAPAKAPVDPDAEIDQLPF